MPRPVAGYIPDFNKQSINKLLTLARKLVPLPYLYWDLYLGEEDWNQWKDRRCDWLDGKPPLARLVQKAWSQGVVDKLDKIEAKGAAFQNLAWMLERFAPHTFGRVDRVVQHTTVKTDKKEAKRAKRAKDTIKKMAPAELRQLRDVVYKKAA